MPLPKRTISLTEEDDAFLKAHLKDHPEYSPTFVHRQAMKKIREEHDR